MRNRLLSKKITINSSDSEGKDEAKARLYDKEKLN
jgi:hypothetical protein